MIVYGGSWNLPGVKDTPNPFIGLYDAGGDAPEDHFQDRPSSFKLPAPEQGTSTALAAPMPPPSTSIGGGIVPRQVIGDNM